MVPRRRFRAVLVGLIATLLGLTGCGTSASSVDPGGREPSSAGRSSSAVSTPPLGPAQTAATQQTLDDFVAAARRGDAPAAAALVSIRDQAFANRAAVWAANLGRLDWRRLTWTARSARAAVTPERRRHLGAEAWVQQVRMTWSYAGETRVAEEDVWLTFAAEPTTGGGWTIRLAGDADSPASTGPIPLWLQQPVELQRRGAVLVLIAPRSSTTWLDQAVDADELAEQRIGVADRDPGGGLVVEVPRSRAAFERVLGVEPGSYAQVAAAAWPMGPDTSTAAIRVVVNPESAGRLSELGRRVLLLHEAVHVATRSPGSPAPTWLVEGYADQIAYDAHPAARTPAERAVVDHVRAHGVPDAWPEEKDFAPDAGDLDLTYDLAWTAAHSIADAYGDRNLNRFYAAVDSGDTLARAADRIGGTERALRQHWRTDLETLAARHR